MWLGLSGCCYSYGCSIYRVASLNVRREGNEYGVCKAEIEGRGSEGVYMAFSEASPSSIVKDS